jgi:hypothetical protein
MTTSKRLISLALCAWVAMGTTTVFAQDDGEAVDGEAEPPVEETPETADGTPVIAQPETPRQWGLGARLRYVFMPRSVLELFLDKATSMNSFGIGVEAITRKGNFDIVFGLEYDSLDTEPGYYQDKGDDPGIAGQYPDFREFDGFGMIGFDASFIWHTKITDKIQLRYGAGIGLGFLTGNMYLTDTECDPGTTLGDLDNADTPKCRRVGQKEEESDVPPVIPILNMLIGTRFMLADNISFNVETGFRDVFYLGAGFGYTL